MNINSRYYPRKLDINNLISDRSCFLFGPRQTGKSSYLRLQLAEAPVLSVNLLDEKSFFEYQRDTRLLTERLAPFPDNSLVVVDEIQRIPSLLNEIHLLIEEKGHRFLMTGSSARQLKRLGTNLLGGRARSRNFHPFSMCEIPDFDLAKALFAGLLPPHWFSRLPNDDLAAYVGRYLAEEIAAEGMSRNLPTFSRFLEAAACCNAQTINMSSIASDIGISRQSVTAWFQILYDTLLAHELPAFRHTIKRKTFAAPKFYFLDMGVVRFLRRLDNIAPGSSDFGEFFEHFIFLEMRKYVDWIDPFQQLSYWRTQRGEYEVDLIVGKKWAIEIKATQRVSSKHLSGLLALREEGLIQKLMVVCQEEKARYLESNDIYIYPWRDFLQDLWNGTGWIHKT